MRLRIKLFYYRFHPVRITNVKLLNGTRLSLWQNKILNRDKFNFFLIFCLIFFHNDLIIATQHVFVYIQMLSSQFFVNFLDI